MNRQQLNTQCDSDRIELFLRGTLSSSETEILELHLTECKSCARQIELAAEQGVSWQEAQCLLAADEYDSPQHISAISSLLSDEHAPMTKYQTADVLSREIRGWLDPTDDPHSMGRFAGYEIVGIVGHGGMGIVLKGFEASLNRYVAIKILAPRLATNGSARKRFAREAQAAAAVRHDNVIAIHRVDEWHGLPFLVMPYAGGISLQKRIDSDGPLSIEQTLRVGVQIASGLAAAHAQGLIHRDIKPANILLEQGVERVTITDFGLARAADDVSVTRTGVIAGTPQYMSPEQAEAKQLDARSDLFSLGSVLYAMATGRPPFRGSGSFEVLNHIVNESARSMREIESSVPEWFENTVNRLHSKSPNDRPASACEVAELLQGCLAHVQQPTTTPMPAGVQALAAHAHASANNVTLISRLNAGLQQTKFIAAAAFAFSLIFAGVLIVLEFNKGTLTIESEVDDVPIRIMQGVELVEKLTLTRSGETFRIAAGNYIVEIDGQTDGITVEDGIVSLQRRGTETVRIVYSGDRVHGSATLAPGADEFATSESDSEFALRKFGDKITVDLYGGSDVLSQMNTRGTNKEKYMRLLLELNAIKGVVTNFRAAGSGNNISMAIVRDPSSQCSQENRRTGKPSETRNAINAALEAAGIMSVRWEEARFTQENIDADHALEARDISSGNKKAEAAQRLNAQNGISEGSVGNSSDWEIHQLIHPAHIQGIWSVTFSPDGKTIASAAADKTVKLWDVSSGELLQTIERPVNCISTSFSPDGTQLAIAGGDHGGDPPGEIIIWDLAASRVSRVLESYENSKYSCAVAFSPDGKWLASGGTDKLVKLWDAASGELLQQMTGHTELVRHVAFTSDGQTLASGSFDKTIRLWNTADGTLIGTLEGHEKEVRSIAFSPDDKLLVSVSDDCTARVWNVASHNQIDVLDGHTSQVYSVEFFPDGRHVVTGSKESMGVLIWDVRTQDWGDPQVFPQQSSEVVSLAISPGGEMLAIAGRWNSFEIWRRRKPDATRNVSGLDNSSNIKHFAPGEGGNLLNDNRIWQQTNTYVAPDFNRFFPDSKGGGLALDTLWNAADKDSRSDAEILNTVREGFRNTRQHRMPILRWIGNKYIWNKSPQNPDAIEIMYHAADFSGEDANPSGARHAAVYFGLSVTQPKTPAILRTLAELSIRVDDPNDLGRIAWGCSNQKEELLEYLKPFHKSDNEVVRNKADVCQKFFTGELQAFVWAAEQAHQRAEKTYSSQLPQFKETLISGSSEERLKALQTILGQRIALIMDDSFVAAFAKCAEDNDPQVRVQTTIIAGAKWVWEAQEKQHPEAIQLMLRLSTDEHRDVRYNAVYYGLSTVRSKSDDVIRRLLEMAFEDREQNLFRRIEWGLRDDRERVAPILNGYIDGSDKIKAKAAREIFKQLTGSEPPLVDTATANDPAHTIVG